MDKPVMNWTKKDLDYAVAFGIAIVIDPNKDPNWLDKLKSAKPTYFTPQNT